MKPTAVKRFTSIFTAALIMILSETGMFPVKASAEGNAASATDSVSQTADSVSKTVDNTYPTYISQYSSVPDATDIISFPLQSAVLANGSAVQTQDGESGIVLPENGTASWTIQVPKTALYVIKMDYYDIPGGLQSVQLGFTVDGKSLFDGASNIELKQIWQDDGGMRKDAQDNDLTPLQKEVTEWKTTYLDDYSDYYNGAYAIYLTAGQHDFSFNSAKESCAIANISLQGKEKLPTYAEVKASYDQKGYKTVDSSADIKIQAESTYEKSSSSLLPTYDRSSPVTESQDGSLNSPSKIRRNTINWYTPGEWASYTVNVEQDGLYSLSFKTRQNYQIGMSVMRDVYVDGKIPYAEMQGIIFPYTTDFQTKTVTDSSGDPCLLYLTKGTHEIRLVATIDRWSDVLTKINSTNAELNQLYRKITMITGTSPDLNRDYQLDSEIPGMIDMMQKDADALNQLSDEFDQLNSGNTSQTSILRTNAKQLQSFVKDPDTIPSRLSSYQSNVAALSDWLLAAKDQSLEIDYFMLTGTNSKLPRSTATFIQNLKFGVSAFLATFTQDYNYMVGGKSSDSDSIYVWYMGSRATAQIIRDMIDDEFTGKTGIKVNLSLAYADYVPATLAGTGPDVALEVNRGTPVNLACRGALLDVSKFDTYNDVMSRFSNGAAIPYTYNGGVYGIPNSQWYYMMFYRTDILNELGLQPPNTWDDLYNMIPILERNNYNVGLPYTTITGQGTESIGLGVKDMFTTLLLQNGGSLYTSDGSRSGLNSDAGIDTFKMWTEFYTKYGFPTEFNANTRLRTGNIPLMIAQYNMYNTFIVGAPEIRGLWDMTLIPGTKKEDGTIDRSVGASGTASVIFKKAKNPEACWKFLDWWSSEDVQYEYGIKLENRLGPEARSATANVKAFDRLPWSQNDVQKLEEQRQSLVEIPEVPGTYIVSRSLDNAFRAVVFDGVNERERFLQEVDTINTEIKRKRVEFGLE